MIMKEIIENVKEIKSRLETLYATKYVLESRGDIVEIIENEILELETRLEALEEIIYAASLVK